MKFKIKIEHIIIAVLAIMLLFKSCGNPCPEDKPTVETTTETKTITSVDSSSNIDIKNRTPEKIKIIEEPKQIRKISDQTVLSEKEKTQIKEVYHYLDTTHLKDARIVSDIISEGRILQNNIRAEIDHKETTITTKETTVKNASGLFLSPGIGYSPLYGIETVEANLTYINKNSFGLSAGIYYNTIQKSTGFKITLHKKIF